MWYYAEGQKAIGPLLDQKILDLIKVGKVSRSTPVYKKGMDKWMPAGETELSGHISLFNRSTKDDEDAKIVDAGFIELPDPEPVQEESSNEQEKPLITKQQLDTINDFADPTRLTNIIKFFIIALIVSYALSALNPLFLIIDRNLEAFVIRVRFIMIASFIIFVCTAILYLLWISQANENARNLGASDMRFTPGMCILWHFIPIANLWKPYQIMKEVWMASSNPVSWKEEKPSKLVDVWWFMYIFNIIIKLYSRTHNRYETQEEAFFAFLVMIIDNLYMLVLSIIFLKLILSVYKMQTKQYGLRK